MSGCAAFVRYDLMGRAARRRRCSRPARIGVYCTIHHKLLSRAGGIDSSEGGFCVWCSEPAVSFRAEGGPTVALCARHARGLVQEIQTVLALADRRA